MDKQAILIMYHTDYYILEKLLQQIDSKYFDIYLHVDKKVKNFDYEYTKSILKKSDIYFINRMNVKWSTYSQIKCEIRLLETATLKKYTYYHIISGCDMLLKRPEEIYNFFKDNYPKEFIGYQSFNDIKEEQLERIKYYHLFNSNRRNNNEIAKIIGSKIYYKLLSIEKNMKINRLKNNKLAIRKGANWVSITDDLAKYILSCKKRIRCMFKYSNCADELFIQTIAYNSKFKNNIFDKYHDEHKNVKRLIDWKRGEPYTYTIRDYNEIINSDCFFARKFSSKKDREIIDKIYDYTLKK